MLVVKLFLHNSYANCYLIFCKVYTSIKCLDMDRKLYVYWLIVVLSYIIYKTKQTQLCLTVVKALCTGLLWPSVTDRMLVLFILSRWIFYCHHYLSFQKMPCYSKYLMATLWPAVSSSSSTALSPSYTTERGWGGERKYLGSSGTGSILQPVTVLLAAQFSI